MNSETMPDELQILLDHCDWIENSGDVQTRTIEGDWKDADRSFEVMEVCRAARAYHAVKRIDPAILAAMDKTLDYYGESEFSIDSYPERENWPVSSHAGGLTVGMLRTLRGILG